MANGAIIRTQKNRIKREGVKAIMAKLMVRGYTYRQMKEEIDLQQGGSISLGTISKFARELIQEWRDSRAEDVKDIKEAELQALNEVIKEGWEAWERSKDTYTRKSAVRSSKEGTDPRNPSAEGDQASVTQRQEEVVQFGDPRYLNIVNEALDKRRKLLGANEPERHEITGKGGAPLFSKYTDEELDARIKALEDINERC